MSYVTPDPESITKLLEMIFGEGVDVTEASADDLAGQHVATFISDNDELVAVCACDVPFVAYSGAALSMIPCDVADEVMASGELTTMMTDNFYEVMNICSKLMMSDSSSHLRLDKTFLPEASADVLSGITTTGNRSGFAVDIPKYGKGALNFLIN